MLWKTKMMSWKNLNLVAESFDFTTIFFTNYYYFVQFGGFLSIQFKGFYINYAVTLKKRERREGK